MTATTVRPEKVAVTVPQNRPLSLETGQYQAASIRFISPLVRLAHEAQEALQAPEVLRPPEAQQALRGQQVPEGRLDLARRSHPLVQEGRQALRGLEVLVALQSSLQVPDT